MENYDYLNNNPKNFEELIQFIIDDKLNANDIDNEFSRIIETAEENNFNLTFLLKKNENNVYSIIYSSQNFLDLKNNFSLFIIFFFQTLKYDYLKLIFSKLMEIFKIFEKLKKSNLIIEDLNKLEYKNIKDIFYKIDISFLQYFYSIFNYDTYIIYNIKSITNHINSLIDQHSLTKYINKYIKIIIDILDNNNQTLLKSNFLSDLKVNKLFDNLLQEKDIFNSLSNNVRLFHIFPDYIEYISKYFIENNLEKNFIHFITKNNFNNNLSNETYLKLKNYSLNKTYLFYLERYKNNQTKLLYIYDLFYNEKFILEKLYNYLVEKNKIIVANKIKYLNYTEEDEIKYETNSLKRNEECNKFIQFDESIKDNIFFLSLGNNQIVNNVNNEFNNLDDILKILDLFQNFNLFGVDTEWKPRLTLFDEKEKFSEIIQIASENYIIIIDCKSVEKSIEFQNKFIDIFKNKYFLGFYFQFDISNMNQFFKSFFVKNTKYIIDLKKVYENKFYKNCPNLEKTCYEILGKELDKKETLSNWSKRPLRNSQKIYAAMDAYILIKLYKILNN